MRAAKSRLLSALELFGLSVLFALVSSTASAQFFDWRSPAGGSFSNPANWLPTTEPGFPDDGGDVPRFGIRIDWEGNVSGGSPITFDRDLTTNSTFLIGGNYRFLLDGHTLSTRLLSVAGSGNDGSRDASVVIEGGMLLTDDDSPIGNQVGRSGSATVQGSGTSWLASGGITVGRAGNGSLLVTDGASVDVDRHLIVGLASGYLGTLEVSNGARLTTGLGGSGTGLSVSTLSGRSGQLLIHTGGVVESRGAVLSNTAAIPSFATVSGPGSALRIHETNLGLGRFPLTIEDGGLVEVEANVTTGRDSIVSVVGSGSLLDVRGDLSVTRQSIVPVTDGGRLRAGSLSLGDGSLRLDGGMAVIGGSLEQGTPGVLEILQDGSIGGSGSIEADVWNGGALSPDSLLIAGGYAETSLASVVFQISGLLAGTEYDQLDVGGDVALGGSLFVSFEELFAPSAGDTFDLVLFGGTAQGAWSDVAISGVAPGFEYEIATVGNAVRLTALNDGQVIPEPGTALLLGGGLLLLAAGRRRSRPAHSGIEPRRGAGAAG
jgi:T5SS/PEP-CTERM-associated repeat protein